MLIKKKDSN